MNTDFAIFEPENTKTIDITEVLNNKNSIEASLEINPFIEDFTDSVIIDTDVTASELKITIDIPIYKSRSREFKKELNNINPFSYFFTEEYQINKDFSINEPKYTKSIPITESMKIKYSIKNITTSSRQ